MEILYGEVSEWPPHVSLPIIEIRGPAITENLRKVIADEGWQTHSYRNLYSYDPETSL